MRRLLIIGILLVLTLLVVSPVQAETQQLVYLVPVSGFIDQGLVQRVQRGYRQAQEAGATAVLLEVETPGGLMESAIAIREIIRQQPIRTLAYVTDRAISAGVLITLAADGIAMAPGTTIGAAEPRQGNTKASEKIVSFWTAEIAATAEEHGRNSQLAAAMADADLEIPGVIERGKLLTLTSKQAVDLGLADVILASREEVLNHFGLSGSRMAAVQGAGVDQLIGWITHPVVAPLLLMVGLAGLVIELFTIGFGVAGTIGLASLALYYGGHIMAGVAGWEAMVLFLAGLILMLMEIFVIPGFGVAGVGGALAVIYSLVLVTGSWTSAFGSLTLAMVGTFALLILSLKYLPSRRVWQRLILDQRQERVEGYRASAQLLKQYEGQQGVAMTPLRPAGTALVDGQRLDVVTEGEFIPVNSPVVIIMVEGNRVVVRHG